MSILTLTLLSVPLGLIGCDQAAEIPSDRAVITGKLSIQGKPLQGGSIYFTKEDDRKYASRASIKQDGSYKTKTAPIGKVLISIETESLRFGGGEKFIVPIPKRYNDIDTSELSREVVAGENEFDIDLKP